MPDRRKGDRRAPERGVIKIPFKDAITYLIFAVILIISFSANVVLAIRIKDYKENYIRKDSYDSYAYYALDNVPAK